MAADNTALDAASGRRLTSWRRLAIAAAVGVLAGVGVALVASWQMAVLVGFDVAALVHLVIVWAGIAGHDATATKVRARVDDPGRAMSSVVLLGAATLSLSAVILGLVKAEQVDGGERAAITAAAIVAVVSGWTTVHTVYLLHYAHHYYSIAPEGGIDFPGGEAPDYRDFAYLAFTIGMTYQVSDTDITDRQIRRMLTRQALLSFLFGTVIIATTINLLAGFVG